jgi:hypothetical protein
VAPEGINWVAMVLAHPGLRFDHNGRSEVSSDIHRAAGVDELIY